MGPYSDTVNKCLLPIDKKAVITHLIERFPAETVFVIALGHLGDQVRSYLEVAHPDRHFEFVQVDRYEGPGTGPGYSLLCCKPKLEQSFYFIAADTLWDRGLDLNPGEDWIGVARVSQAESAAYCNLRIVQEGASSRVAEIIDKKTCSPDNHRAFIGFAHIKNTSAFWKGFERPVQSAGEIQVSNGLNTWIEGARVGVREIVWTDVGDYEKYRREAAKYENFDFSKSDEFLYIVPPRVVKFFRKAEVTDARVKRASKNPSVFPAIERKQGSFYAYQFVKGQTLYETVDPSIFARLLDWLQKSLWKPVQVDAEAFKLACDDFYRKKTGERIALYQKKYPRHEGSFKLVSEAGEPEVQAIDSLLARVPWDQLRNGVPKFFHGDLQFDNILYDRDSAQFLLLDWRQDFAGNVDFGDQYYDLAKLYGGILLNYDYIKGNLFRFERTGREASLDFAQRRSAKVLVPMLERKIEEMGLDVSKVRLMVGLIYLNMSPLHHAPFDQMLFHLGSWMVQTELEARGL